MTTNTFFEQTTTQDFALQPLGGVISFRNSFDTPAERDVWRFVNYSGSAHQWHFTDQRSVSEPFSAWHGNPATGSYPANQAVGMISPTVKIPADEDLDLTFKLSGQIDGPYHAFVVFVLDVETGMETPVYEYVAGTQLPWTEVTVNMAPFAGRTVTLEFYVQSDFFVAASDTGMFIDDVMIGYVDPAFDSVIAGVIRDVDGKPVGGTTVTVVELEPTGEVTRMSQTTTDAQGRYEMTVPAGGWTVRATKAPDFVSSEQIVYAQPGSAVPADFALEENLPPTLVTGLQADVGDGTVRLFWDANEDSDLAGYNVYRSLDNENFHRIGATQDPQFTADGLQNHHLYFFRVAAVDVYGLEGDAAEIEATPIDTVPTVQRFDVQPRTLARGGSLVVSALLGHPLGSDMSLDVRIEAKQGTTTVGEWEFLGQEQGDFEVVVDTLDMFGKPWPPNICGLTLYATDANGVTGVSNTVNIAVLAPLPQALGFLLGNNPFNPQHESQRLEYALPSAGQVTVAVYTLDGRRVATLVDETRPAGQYVTFWDGADDSGKVVLAGMYVVRIHFTSVDGQRTDLTRHSVVVK